MKIHVINVIIAINAINLINVINAINVITALNMFIVLFFKGNVKHNTMQCLTCLFQCAVQCNV